MNKIMIRPFSILMVLMILQGCSAPSQVTGGTDTLTTTPVTSPVGTTAPGTSAPGTAPGTTVPLTAPGTLPGTTTSGEATDVNYRILREVPDGMKDTLENYKKNRGYYYDSDEQILVIFMGERSTGGYSMSLEDIQARDATLQVTVAERSPGPNDIVTQAFTYPMLILELEKGYDDFDIRAVTTEPYEPLDGLRY